MTQWITEDGALESEWEKTMMQEPEINRWTAKRKAELIRQIYKGEASTDNQATSLERAL